ncbi:MAG: helix-hairpin-helix domain-containing protein [Deltaproteobacteria bacterium]
MNLTAKPFDTPNLEGEIYIEIVEESFSTVIKINTINELNDFAKEHNINSELNNGHKVTLKGKHGAVSGRITGIKSMSLGVPIGINSAGIEDLKALPGIGDTLARRIVQYRTANGRIEYPSDLLNVEGVGRRKLAAIKNLISLD